MNWDPIIAISEIVGAVGIIVSVLYLAMQVKATNELNRVDTFRSTFQGLAAFSLEMFGPENAALLVKGYRDFATLAPEEKLRFDNLMSNYFNYIEDSFRSAKVKLLGDDTMEGWAWWLRNRLFAYEGVSQWWFGGGKDIFPPEFQDWVNEQARAAQPSNDSYGIVSDL